MDEFSLLDKIKILLSLDATFNYDDILQIYLDNANDFIYDYCKITEIPSTVNSVLMDMVIFQYRSKGVENLTREDKGSLVENYITEYPSNIINRLNRYRRIQVI